MGVIVDGQLMFPSVEGLEREISQAQAVGHESDSEVSVGPYKVTRRRNGTLNKAAWGMKGGWWVPHGHLASDVDVGERSAFDGQGALEETFGLEGEGWESDQDQQKHFQVHWFGNYSFLVNI